MKRLFLALAVAAGGGLSPAFAEEKSPAQDVPAFGALRTASPEAVRTQAQEWLKLVGKTDDATKTAFQAIWNDKDRAVLDRVTDTLALGNPDAGKLLAEALDPLTPAPKEVPALLKDDKQQPFLRANLALAYGKALSSKRVYEEALESIASVKPEQVVDPSSYYFHRAVAEHALMKKDEATRSIGRLLEDCVDSPERYKTVAALMFFDLQSWKKKDLGEISRLMNNSERRLDLARGGPGTQKIQRDILNRLDELIKKIEQQQQQQQQQAGGA